MRYAYLVQLGRVFDLEHNQRKAMMANIMNRRKIVERADTLRFQKSINHPKENSRYDRTKINSITNNISYKQLTENALALEKSNLDKKLLQKQVDKLSKDAITEYKKHAWSKDKRLTQDDKDEVTREFTSRILNSLAYLDSAPNPNSTTNREIYHDPTSESWNFAGGNDKGNGRNARHSYPYDDNLMYKGMKQAGKFNPYNNNKIRD